MFEIKGSEKTLKDPTKPIDLFKNLTDQKNPYSTNEVIKEMFDRIEILDSEGKLNEKQIKEITQVAGKLHFSRFDNEIKNLYAPTY